MEGTFLTNIHAPPDMRMIFLYNYTTPLLRFTQRNVEADFSVYKPRKILESERSIASARRRTYDGGRSETRNGVQVQTPGQGVRREAPKAEL